MERDEMARELLAQLQRLAALDGSQAVLRLEVRTADGEYMGFVPLAETAALVLTEDVESIANYPGLDAYTQISDEDAFGLDPDFEDMAAAVDAVFTVPGEAPVGHWDRALVELVNSPYTTGILAPRITDVEPDPDDDLPLPEGTWDGQSFRLATGQDGDL